jgi:hypothetical protein
MLLRAHRRSQPCYARTTNPSMLALRARGFVQQLEQDAPTWSLTPEGIQAAAQLWGHS